MDKKEAVRDALIALANVLTVVDFQYSFERKKVIEIIEILADSMQEKES